jgi:hypothetical protein
VTLHPKDPRDAAYDQGVADARLDRESRDSSCSAWLAPWYADGYKSAQAWELIKAGRLQYRVARERSFR